LLILKGNFFPFSFSEKRNAVFFQTVPLQIFFYIKQENSLEAFVSREFFLFSPMISFPENRLHRELYP